MTPKTLANQYDKLEPGERFALILTAGARGDEVEQARLVRAGRRITLSLQDHAPFAHAFDQIALLVFIELLADASAYLESLHLGDEEAAGDEGGEPDEEEDGTDGERPLWSRSLDLALARGYVLKARAGGWQTFCERRGLPPFAVWKGLPGFDHLQRALDVAD